MDKDIVISTRTILSVLVLIGIFWVAIQVQAVLLLVFMAFVVALGLLPVVEKIESKGLPRPLAVIFTLFAIGGSFLGLITLAFSPLISQTQMLIVRIPTLLESIPTTTLEKYITNFGDILTQQVAIGSNNVIQFTVSAAGGLITAVMVLFLAGYLMIDMDNIEKSLVKAFPPSLRKLVDSAYVEIKYRLGSWLRGQLILMLVVGLLSFVGLSLLQVDFALSLAVLAGLFEVVPNIGPIVASIPAAIIGFSISPFTGFGVLALFILIQQVENNLIVPKVMKKAVGFNPIVTIIALLVGVKLFGLLGALLAIPVTLILTIAIQTVLLGYEQNYK